MSEITEFTDIIFQTRMVGGEWWFPPRGNLKDPKLVLVMSHPNRDDCNGKELLCKESPYYTEVKNALDLAEITIDEVYITSMVKHGIGAKPKPTSEQIESGAAQLDYELSRIKPKLIMTLGAEPFKRMVKSNTKQSDFIGQIIDSPYGKLVPNYSPGMIITQDPKKRINFQDTFLLARKYLDDNLNYDKFDWIIVDDPLINIEILQSYIDRGLWSIGYDAEWCGSKMTDDEVMYTFQYCCEPHKAVILNISTDGIGENKDLLDSMKMFLEHPKADRLGWNIRADDKRLKLRGFNIPEETLGFDGMKACAFIDSRLEKGLETGIKKFTKYEPYYTDLTTVRKDNKIKGPDMSKVKFIAPEIFYKYCAGDAVSHREACINMRNHMKAKLPKKVQDYYFNTYLPLTNYFMDLELHGIPIDVDVMEDITVKYTDKYNELFARVKGLIDPIIPEFNPASAPQKKHLLFDILKLTPAYYTKSGKSPKSRAWYDKQKIATQKQYSPSTNGKSLSTIRFELTTELIAYPDNAEIQQKLEIVSTLLDLTRVGVFAKKFLNKQGAEYLKVPIDGEYPEEDEEDEPLKSSYWAALCRDGRIHADFFECLNNFRSSSKVNVQNPASKVLSHIPNIFVPGYDKLSKEDRKEQDILIPRNIRHIFYPGNPDYLWAEVDVAGADLAIAAFLSKDPDYITDILKGSFHLTKAREYFQDPKITKDDYSKYVSAKAITFRVAYTSELKAAALPIQAEIFAESGILVQLENIEYALKTWERYEKYINYREECKAQVKSNQYIENARGMRYNFEESEDRSILAGWQNESLAFPIASELALFMWDICVQTRSHFQKDKVWNKFVFPINSVHDASIWLVHKDLVKDGYFPEICKYYFTDKCKIATGDNLGIEMTVGDRWKASKDKVVFNKETTWDFEKKCWNWKN